MSKMFWMKRFILCYLGFHMLSVTMHGFEIINNGNIELQRKLHDDILKGYNPYIIPSSQNVTQPVAVGICIYMLALEEVNLRGQTITARAYLKIEWNDFQLQWVPDIYGGTTKIYIPVERIWKPDIFLMRSFELNIGVDGVLAAVTFDGNVTVWGFGIYKMSSMIYIQDYPFDTQECNFQLGMWAHSSQDVIFDGRKAGIDLSFYSESSEWYFETQEAIVMDYFYGNDSYPVILYPFTLKRKVLFDIMNNIMPCVLISFLTVLVFKLPTDSGERNGLCTALFLTSAVFLTSIKDSLPVNSEEVSILEIYITSQLLGNVIAVILTIVSIRIRCKSMGDHLTGNYNSGNRQNASNDKKVNAKGTMFEYNNLKMEEKENKCPLSGERKDVSFDSDGFDYICFYAYVIWFMTLHLWLLIKGLSKGY